MNSLENERGRLPPNGVYEALEGCKLSFRFLWCPTFRLLARDNGISYELVLGGAHDAFTLWESLPDSLP